MVKRKLQILLSFVLLLSLCLCCFTGCSNSVKKYNAVMYNSWKWVKNKFIEDFVVNEDFARENMIYGESY